MKTKIFILIAVLALLTPAQSQISITAADFPVANDTVRFSTSTGTVNVSTTGANVTWNYATMPIASQDMYHCYSTFSTELLKYVLYFSGATFGVSENNINLGPLGGGSALQDVYSFYKKTTGTNSALVCLGRGATLQGLPAAIIMNPKDTVYKFPLSFGDKDSTIFYGSASLASIGSLVQSGSRVTQVDGWGSITTPYGTFNCIRVKSTIKETDTVVFSGLPIPIPANRTEYRWFATGHKYPILEVIVNQTGGQTIRFKDKYRPEAFATKANFTASKTIALTTDTINLTSLSNGNPKSFLWSITPNTISFVGGTSATDQNPRVLFNAAGKYSIKFTVTYEGGKDDTTRTDYVNVSSPGAGLNDLKTNGQPLIYPNPANTEIIVESPNSSLRAATIRLFDISGKQHTVNTVFSANKASLDVSAINRGVYILRVEQGGKTFSQKVVIK